jgi:hypothetical protein
VTEGHPEHGTLSEEAARLAEAVQVWLRGTSFGAGAGEGENAGAATASVPDPGDASAAEGGHTPAECRVCPVCQGLRLLRTTRPEVFEHLSDAAASLAAAVRETVADPDRGGQGGPAPRGPQVQRIDVG